MIRCLVLLSALCAAPLSAQTGRALFTGAPGVAEASGNLHRFPCHSCHGRDAQGGIEGDVPSIDWRDLSRPTAVRPAYDAALFARAVTDGVDSGGRELSRLMPRYDLSETQGALLHGYLSGIDTDQRRGVAPATLRIGIMTLPGFPDLSRRYVDAFEAGVFQRLGGRAAYGRRILPVPVTSGARPETLDVLAVVAVRADRVERYTRAGMPVLFPIGALSGDEDPSIVRAATPSRRAVRARLAQEIATTADRVTILPSGSEADELALALRLRDPALDGKTRIGLAGDDARQGALVLLKGAALPEEIRAWNGPVWFDWRLLRDGSHVPSAPSVSGILETPLIAREAVKEGRHPILVQAERAGVAVAEALKAAGRDVTRASLLTALEDSTLLDIGLNYADHPLTGTDTVVFMPIPPDAK